MVPRSSRVVPVLLLLSTNLLAAPAHHGPPPGDPGPERSEGRTLAEAELATLPRNFGEVTSWLYRGGQPSRNEIRSLAAMGVKTIVDLRRGERTSKQRLARELGMSYVTIPMSARADMKDEDIAALLTVLDDPARRPVYVHCLAGKHRTGVMIALYRVMREGMRADDAYDEMERYEFGGRFPDLRAYVYATAARLEERRAVEVASDGSLPSEDALRAAVTASGASGLPARTAAE